MNRVESKDGTTIAYEKTGKGQPLILVDGALCYRDNGPNRPLAAELSGHFTVYAYDRRGRGGSSEVKPYTVEREIEDIEALIGEAGGAAFLYGISSGAALVLEAAARIPAIKKVAVYEAPFIVDNCRPPVPDNYLDQINERLSAGRRGSAVKLFMGRGAGVPALFVAMMPIMPAWSKLKAVAHTLPYDTILTVDLQRGKPYPAGRWSGVTVPALVVDGGKSEAWMRNAMQALAKALPNAAYQTLPGQTHIVKQAVLAPVLRQFFST